MAEDKLVVQAAEGMIQTFGNDAYAQAVRSAERCASRGDHTGLSIWTAIAKTIKERKESAAGDAHK
jgi:hypothetical protein